MSWNWELENWPNFNYDPAITQGYEEQFLKQSGILIGSFKHMSDTQKTGLTIALLSEEALTTSEIEGEQLKRVSIQSSIQRHFGFKCDEQHIPPAEKGIADMMVDLVSDCHSDLSDDRLFKWHRMVCAGNPKIKEIGCYRTDPEPMQVVSGYFHKPKVHFEAPPSGEMPKQMAQFIDWFNATGPNKTMALPPLIRAGVAHIYFISIHPFEDGNGRIGRAISELALFQSTGAPHLLSLSKVILDTRNAYYAQIERINKTLDIGSFLTYFSETILDAQRYTIKQVGFLIKKGQFYARFSDGLNDRQKKVVDRLFRAGIDGFAGGLSAKNYISITHTSRATATRDLQELVEMAALTKIGVGKGTRYYLNLSS